MEQWNTVGKASVFDALARVVKATANGRRLEVLELLAQGEHSVEALARMSGMGVSTVSAHLQTLKKAGLVATRRERTTIYYSLASDDVAELYVVAKRVALRHSPELRETVVAYLEQSAPGTAVPTIDPAAVTSDMTVVDVRPAQEFEAGHFPGAVSIPQGEIDDRAGELPPGARVVVYCRGEFCRMAREAAQRLRELGVDAVAMDEGVVEWRVSKDVVLDGIA
jgi:DNA-binding transcriptional ArsR family regulator/rhodanese-related sulfurtransferase